MSDDDLHAEYAWAFVLHNLVPFADKLLGIAGAMDQLAPLSWGLWTFGRCALSIIIWAAARPTIPDGGDGRPRHECHLLGRAHAGRLGLHVLGRADGADLYRGGALEQRNSY